MNAMALFCFFFFLLSSFSLPASAVPDPEQSIKLRVADQTRRIPLDEGSTRIGLPNPGCSIILQPLRQNLKRIAIHC